MNTVRTVVGDEFIRMEITVDFAKFNHFYSKLYICYSNAIIIMLENLTNKAKDIWRKHKYKILAGVSFSFAAYFAWKYMEGETSSKWSDFTKAIELNKVKEVVVDGDTIFFRS